MRLYSQRPHGSTEGFASVTRGPERARRVFAAAARASVASYYPGKNQYNLV